MLEVKNLTKKYGDKTAVEDLNFSIGEGKIYGFLGPNGAGKSTTMNIITGFLAPTKGNVTINGLDILRDPVKAKACMGYLPEIPPLYPDMTVEEYLCFASELKKVPKAVIKDEVKRLMERTHTLEVKDRLIKNLSKGFRQRVGLSQALAGDPKLIILDEPTVGLDPLQIIEIRQLIKELGEDHTIILSSHILQEISAVCDHIMVISKGRLVADDTLKNLAKGVEKEKSTFLMVKGEADGITEEVKALEGVKEVEATAAEEEGVINLKIKSEGEKDIREQLFFLMSKKGHPILEMKSSVMTLEDVYLKLTEEILGTENAETQQAESGSVEDKEETLKEAEEA